ncbi:MAG: metal-dependent hydrolase [Ignavibacteria bacterium]
MKIIYHGHSFVEVITGGKTIFIDPFIEGNPFCDIKKEDAKCDYIILTHGHDDHFGDTIEIAKANDATVIAMVELSDHLYLKKIKSHGMSIGGAFHFPFGKIKLTIAHHSSSTQDGVYTGSPAGVIIISEGKTLYHAGDTGLFYDMKLIGEMNKIDIAFLPIGDNYTMGVDDAVKAAEFINAETVVPIHYNTFDVIKADDIDFKRKIESIGKKCFVMKSGDEVDL